MSEISKLIEPNNPALRVRLNEVTEKCDREKIVKDLTDSMEHYQGIGLSANQIGIMERVFIMYEDINTRKILGCFNPRIIEMSKEQVSIDEGCLSYPGIWLKIKRPYAIKVEFENEKGEKQERELIDLPSRIFQHELDHMLGRQFTERVSKLKLDMAMKKGKKQWKLAQRRQSLTNK